MENPSTVEGMLEQKESTHGSFKANARIYKKLCDVVQSEGSKMNLEQQLVTDVIFIKLARIIAGDPNFRGHWEDVAGMAKLGSDACE